MKSKPKVYVLSQAEEEELRKRMNESETEQMNVEKEEHVEKGSNIDDEFDLDTYDDDSGVADVFLNNSSKADDDIGAMEIETEDMEDLCIQDEDNVMIVAKAEEETSGLEIHIYNGDTGDFFVHHDIPLSSFPLCVEWLDCPSRTSASNDVGSFAAVGTFRPIIEIWDLDILNAMEPHATLGSEDGIEVNSQAHSDAVLSLNWNSEQRNLVASASADASVKVWDISKQSCALTLRHHKDKVGCVKWNLAESSVLATGSSDKSLCVVDVKSPSKGIRIPLGASSGEVESIAWNPFSPPLLLVSTDTGRLSCYDIRKIGSGTALSLFTVQAHEEAISSVSFSPLLNGLLATASADQTVKLWDVQGNKPSMLASKNMGVGPLFSVAFNPNSSYLLFCGGQEGKIAIWETEENAGIERRFCGRDSVPAGDMTTTTTTTTTTTKKKKSKKRKGKKKRK